MHHFFLFEKSLGFPNHHHLSQRPRGQESAPLRVIEIVAPEGLGYPGYGLDEDFNRGEKAITKSSLCVCVFFGHGKKVTMMMMMMMMMMQCLPHAHLGFFLPSFANTK